MSRIRAKDTKPEMLVRRFLFAHGYRFRIHVRKLPGTPDIVMRRLHTVIQVNGCFWHGHEDGCRMFRMPKTNRDFWVPKIERNRARDQRSCAELRAMGWNVIRIWECQLLPDRREQTLESLLFTLSTIELDVAAAAATKRRASRYCFDTESATAMVADDSDIMA